jgi:hypothetical protein
MRLPVQGAAGKLVLQNKESCNGCKKVNNLHILLQLSDVTTNQRWAPDNFFNIR